MAYNNNIQPPGVVDPS